jgi:hypothetical protein
MNEEDTTVIDGILAPYAGAKGIAGYRNHVLRLISFAFTLDELDDDERRKVVIAAGFHDLGLFSADTLDYLPPSIELAERYLVGTGNERWVEEITEMIDEHHKLRQADDRLVELFRRADLIDFSLGVFRFGLERSYISEVKRAFPNSGFHAHLLRTAGRWICRHPLNPVPVVKW